MPLGQPSYFATYNQQRVTPYAGEAQPSDTEQRMRMALGQRLAAAQPSAYGAPTPMSAPGAPPPGSGGIFGRMGDAVANPGVGTEADMKKRRIAAATSAEDFANQGQAGYGNMTGELDKQRQFFNDMMMGRNSVATEQLRQGLQQQQAMQQSMAAGASPQNAAMAARTAAMQMGRNSMGMAGQAALAQLQERQMAADQLSKLNLGQRDQDINVGLGSRKNQLDALGTEKPKGPSDWQKIAGAGAMAAGLFSDERLKNDVKDGTDSANRAMKALAAKTYRYKDQEHGKGEQLGFLAQDLEKVVPDAIIETPIGKAVHAGKLAGANTAMISALERRLSKIEGKGK